MRLIDADALLDVLNRYDDGSEFKNDYEYGLQQRLDTCINAVEDAPTVDVSPCDVCRYSPPSSGDGKPCTLCPAEGR